MNLRFYVLALAVWLLFAVLGNINGIIRNYVYGPFVGEWAGHVISTVFMVVFLTFGTYLFLNNLVTGYSTSQLVFLGVFWTVLTMAFEFGFGHFVIGHSWGRLLGDYNILEGRVWSLVLLTTLTAPYIVGKIID